MDSTFTNQQEELMESALPLLPRPVADPVWRTADEPMLRAFGCMARRHHGRTRVYFERSALRFRLACVDCGGRVRLPRRGR